MKRHKDRWTSLSAGLAMTAMLAGCGPKPVAGGSATDATPTTLAANAAMARELALDDPQDFEDAKRGFIARPTGKLLAADGSLLKDFGAYAFLDAKPADTVNPSLWRHAQLNANVGLYKVTDGVYQVRGFDIANLTLIEGKTGWIVVDTLSARETAAAAMAFARQHLGHQRVSAIVFTHAHVDHFGGVLGVVSAEDVRKDKLPVVAPAGFLEEATSENVLVGTGMARRSAYQFGKNLPRSALGNVDTGLGKDLVYGSVGILQPNVLITEATQHVQLDGVEFVFHNVPGAECPAELSFSLPALKLYDGAENLAHTMHNLLPLRGAKVRDALRWSGYLDQAIEQAAGADIYIASHNWPIWGRARIGSFISAHRDIYQYMHDQTVRLINAGYTAREIADMVVLPKALASVLSARGYYGDLRHNVKAIYQFYLGAYDANPANLNPLPANESARRYLELMGGTAKAVAAAQAAYDKGDYRWAAELLNQAVLGDPKSQDAKTWLARTYEQMGYMAESSTWRNAYLSGAQELREGAPTTGFSKAAAVDMLLQTPTERFLEAIAASLNGPAAEGRRFKLNLVLTDLGETHVLWLENAVLHHQRAAAAPDADATLRVTRPLFVKMLAGSAGLKDTLMSDELKVEGSRIELVRFFGLLDKAPGTFPIVTRP